jgi:hypothetical protein
MLSIGELKALDRRLDAFGGCAAATLFQVVAPVTAQAATRYV